MLEEKQIVDFVHRVAHDEALREELVSDPDSVIVREKFSPMVAAVVRKLVPHLSLIQDTVDAPRWDIAPTWHL